MSMISSAKLFTKVLGTGGIGTGVLFALEGNATLGRNESRMAHRLASRDYCKQHIILHYVATLGKAKQRSLTVLPIGAVGADDAGTALLNDMTAAGMDVRHVRQDPRHPTLSCVAFFYPDGSGGNLTECRSASAQVSTADMHCAKRELIHNRGRAMVLAAPEVPLSARIALLKLGKAQQAFTAASFVSEEIPILHKKTAWLKLIDLLSINIDEAAMLAGVNKQRSTKHVVERCAKMLAVHNPQLKLAITDGAQGSYGCEQGVVEYLPAIKARVSSTAGAGDAFLSGLMLGVLGDQTFIGSGTCTAHKLARLVSAMSVESSHTIHDGISAKSLRTFANKHQQRAVIEAFYA